MNKVKTIGQWKYFVLSYLVMATALITYFLIPDSSSAFILWIIIVSCLLHLIIVARNPILKIEDQTITLVYLFSEKNILKKDVIKIEPIPGIFFSYFLVTTNAKYFLLLNPFMTYVHLWTSKGSYSEEITSMLKEDKNS